MLFLNIYSINLYLCINKTSSSAENGEYLHAVGSQLTFWFLKQWTDLVSLSILPLGKKKTSQGLWVNSIWCYPASWKMSSSASSYVLVARLPSERTALLEICFDTVQQQWHFLQLVLFWFVQSWRKVPKRFLHLQNETLAFRKKVPPGFRWLNFT